ncbi:MAG TPA: hypothetical protein DGG95_03510 [Cytophagales bacterium]|nr:hypothetical protein [Cytophagales bacterium]
MKNCQKLLFILFVLAQPLFAQTISLKQSEDAQSLKGDWEFVWDKLLTPQDFSNGRSGLVKVPHSWKNNGHPHYGIGTYRVNVRLQNKVSNYSILFPLVNSSAKIWLNKKLIDEIGVCSSDPEKYKAKFTGLLIAVPADTTQLELVVQVANYSYSFGGLVRAPLVGPTSVLVHDLNKRKGLENFFVGSLMAMFIYQIILFFLYQRGKPYLYLGLICLIVALRATVTHGGSFLMLDLFPDVSVEFWKKLEFFSVYAVVAIFPLYSYYLFPQQAYKKPIPIFVVGSIVLCLIVIFSSHLVYYLVLDVCHILLIGGFIYSFAVIFRAWRAGNKDASIILLGVLASFPFIILEIAQNSRIIYFDVSFPYLVEMGVLVFLLFQVYLLANHYALAYRNLEQVNADLEVKVKTRTQELTKANQVRERLLSILSHDMKGPLNSLRGVLDIYRQGGFSESELKSLTGNIEVNLSSTSMLMDNILLWTSSQLKGVKTNFSKFNLRQLVDEHFAIFKAAAERKNISLINSVQEIEVESDKQILSLVLRNLIANAIKFSFENGKIEVLSTRDENYFILQIKDNGKGMEQKIAESLFLAEDTISMEGTHLEKGTGVGLALCYDYLCYVNGEISVQSEVNKGSIFTIRIPLKRTKLPLMK